MVKRSSIAGQNITEYILMLAIMTVIGAMILIKMTGTKGKGGAINSMGYNTPQKIAKDDRP